MIQALGLYNRHHTFWNLITESIATLQVLVSEVALNILRQIVISAPFLYAHPNLFVLGFGIGFVFDKQIRHVVNKVNIIFEAHRTLFERLLLFVGGGVFALYTMPASLMTATLYYSAKWGALFYKTSEARLRARGAHVPFPPSPIATPPQQPDIDNIPFDPLDT